MNERKHGFEWLEEDERNMNDIRKIARELVGGGIDFVGMTTDEIEETLIEMTKEKRVKKENPEEAEKDICEISDEIKELLIRKNKEYGDGNLCTHGHAGILVRLSDKISRLENLKDIEVKEDEIRKFDEKEFAMEEQYKDIAGYAINALRLMRRFRI